MSDESAVSSVAVTTTAKGEAQIAVKVYPVTRMPGMPVQPEANIHDVEQLRAALKELADKQTDYADRLTSANEAARDALPDIAVRLYLETAAKLEANDVPVAGDPDARLLKVWNAHHKDRMAALGATA